MSSIGGTVNGFHVAYEYSSTVVFLQISPILLAISDILMKQFPKHPDLPENLFLAKKTKTGDPLTQFILMK
jgi:hypothetical protein